LLNISVGPPIKEPFLKVPFMESLASRCPVPTALLQPSFKVPGIGTSPPDKRFPSVIKGPLYREMPASGDFLNISSRVPSEGAPPPPPRPPHEQYVSPVQFSGKILQHGHSDFGKYVDKIFLHKAVKILTVHN
jgi:hypothetical protein